MFKITEKNQKKIIILFVAASFLLLLNFIYRWLIYRPNDAYLKPPSLRNWFGTDLTGDDVFLKSMDALGIEIITLLIVLASIYILGFLFGMGLSYFNSPRLREFLLNLIHYWVTLPILLIALFLLIMLGAGQLNAIAIMVFVFTPTQAIYVFNQLETVKKNDFVPAKLSYGFTKSYIYIHHLIPNIRPGYHNYTLSRMPEIVMLNLGLNFLGLGVQPPHSSFGRMLFDGLAFMFSAWWLWAIILVKIILIMAILTNFSVKEFDYNGN